MNRPLLSPAWPLPLARTDLVRTGAFVDGRWIDEGPTFPVYDPATGALLAEVVDGDAALARRATEAAVKAFPAWRDLPAKRRGRLLLAWFGAVQAHADDLARIISSEQGKPLSDSRAEIGYGAGYLEWFAEEAKRAYGETIPAPLGDRRLVTVKEPLGVAAVITPWNFPMAMIARKFGPALAAGCTVVGRPAEDTPLSALALMVLAEEVGIPPGVLNLVPSARERAGEIAGAWMEDERVRAVSFTGSTAVGRALARGSADTLKHVSLELGGDAPFIVFESADLDAAVAGLLKAKFRNAGQACTSPNRILVQASVKDAFLAKLAPAVSRLKAGPATDPASDIGPLINLRALDKVSGLVADARDRGARALVGGAPDARGGGYFQPTLLADVSPEMKLTCEEIFGPVIAVQSFADEAEALQRANASSYGLAGYFFSRDYAQVMRVSARLQTGMVAVNEGLFSTEVAPFGGVKASGYGREGSLHGLDDYMSVKFICLGGLG